MLSFIEEVMSKSEEMTEEEERLYLLCFHLVELYEKDIASELERQAGPLDVLYHLMEARHETMEDIIHLMDENSIAPLKGERPFSTAEVQRLGYFYNIGKDVFSHDIHD